MTQENNVDDANMKIDPLTKLIREGDQKAKDEPFTPVVRHELAELLTSINTVSELEPRIKLLEEKIKLLEEKTKPVSANKYHFWIFGAALVFVIYLLVRSWPSTPTVSISFNVGDIIQGVLVGAAAVFAGVAYARKQLDKNENKTAQEKPAQTDK